MRVKSLNFKNRLGLILAARLDLPNGMEPAAYAILAHCFTCSKNLKAIAYISRALAASGIAVLRFDFAGIGESEGDFGDTNLSSNVHDLIDAARFLERHYRAPELLVGHSFGGVAVLQAVREIPTCRALAVIGMPSRADHIFKLIGRERQTILKEGRADVVIEGRTFQIKKQFLEDVSREDILTSVKKLNCGLMVMHSPLDTTVGIDHAANLFIAAKHPKSFVSLDRADHLLTKKEDAAYAGHVIAVWAQRYFTMEAEKNQKDSI